MFVVEDKPKTLPASLRPRKRYIIFQVISEKPVDYIELVGAIWRTFLNFLGEMKTSEMNFWLIKNLYDQKNQRGVIRCSPDQVEYARAALALIDQIGETKALIKINTVTGTIRSAKKKYLGFTDLTDFEK